MPCLAPMRTRSHRYRMQEPNFDWIQVRLASSLIACNLGCNPRRENKVLMPILFLIGIFHFDHLYK
jgi:hypothetical protein